MFIHVNTWLLAGYSYHHYLVALGYRLKRVLKPSQTTPRRMSRARFWNSGCMPSALCESTSLNITVKIKIFEAERGFKRGTADQRPKSQSWTASARDL